MTLAIAESNRQFTPKTWVVRFHLTSGVRSVTADSLSVAHQYDAKTGVLEVTLANGGAKAHLIRVALDGTRHPRPKPPVTQKKTSPWENTAAVSGQVTHPAVGKRTE